MITVHLRLILHDNLGRSDGNMNGYNFAVEDTICCYISTFTGL